MAIIATAIPVKNHPSTKDVFGGFNAVWLEAVAIGDPRPADQASRVPKSLDSKNATFQR
jgi:hypothetical protein